MAKITNYNQAWQAYQDSTLMPSLDDFLPDFVKKYPKLVSTAPKAARRRMEELNILSKPETKEAQKLAEHKPVQENKKKQSDKQSQKPDQESEMPNKIKTAKKDKDTDQSSKLDDDISQAIKVVKKEKARTVKRNLLINKMPTASMRNFPRSLIAYAKQEIGYDETNASSVAALLIALINTDFAGKDKIDPHILDLAKKYQHTDSLQNTLATTKQLKRELDEVRHLNEQLLLMLSYYISITRWGLGRDSGVNKPKDIANVDFANNGTRELIKITRKVSDDLLKEREHRLGSNQRY